MVDPAPPTAGDPDGAASALIALVVAVGVALVVSFVCSISEAVLLSVGRGDVERMAKEGSRAGKILRRWKRSDIEVPIAAILILNTLAHTIGATVAGSSYEQAIGGDTLWIFSLVFTLAVLVFTEIIPKTLGVAFAHQLAKPVTLMVSAMTTVLKPMLLLTSAISKLVTGGHERPSTSIEEIRLLAALGKREGAVGPRVAAFIEGVTNLRDLTVHDVMVPRGGVVYLSGTKSLEENLALVRSSGHSRFPFTPTGELDNVDSVILAKELLFFEHDERANGSIRPPAVGGKDELDVDWDRLKAPLLVVPASKSLDELLRTFQEHRKHLAVVVDEYGGTQGVITLEDVLEEIVGEIEDETDPVEQLIEKRVEDGKYICKGWAETRKVFNLVGIEERSDFVTISGFIADLIGHVPVVGDEVEHEGVTFKVTRASARRAERIVVTPRAGQPADSMESAPEG